MAELKFLRRGKVKEVYDAGPNELEFYFTDNISVFDKIIPSQIPFKGETLNHTSAHWFDVAKKMGIRTHYLGMAAPNRMRVKKVQILQKPTKKDNNFLVPLEFICRYYVAGSMHDGVKEGLVTAEELGFRRGYEVNYGDELPEPFFEVTTKLEKVDRHVGMAEALDISGLTLEEFNEIKEAFLKIDWRINADVKKRGLVHVDGKKEFALDSEREPMLIDTFGTADEDRWWDLKQHEQGKFIELSKEFVRQHYRDTGYHGALMEARKLGKPEPDIPALPSEMVKKVSELYIDLFAKITGEKFR